MFFACGIWCLVDVSSVSPSSEQTQLMLTTTAGRNDRTAGIVRLLDVGLKIKCRCFRPVARKKL